MSKPPLNAPLLFSSLCTHMHSEPSHTLSFLNLPTHTAYLTHESVELQELAANSDRLIASLVEYLQERPDENDDLVQEKHFTMFDNLREVFLCVGEGRRATL